MIDILEKLEDLRIQSTKEKSHYYVKDVVTDAILEIQQLRFWNNQNEKVLQLTRKELECLKGKLVAPGEKDGR